MIELYRYNGALGSWTKIPKVSTRGQVDAFVKQLNESSVLDHTRSFVCWMMLENGVRTEVARGLAR